MSDFTVWRHTWRKNWVNFAVLAGNSAGLRTDLSSHLSHRKLRSSIRESHSFLSWPFYPPQSHAQEDTQNWQTWWETCAVPENIQFSFFVPFFSTVKLHSLTYSVWGPLRCMGPFRVYGTLNTSVRCKVEGIFLTFGDVNICVLGWSYFTWTPKWIILSQTKCILSQSDFLMAL